MQDRYFGDVGDFGKYGLLRALTGAHSATPPSRLGIVWYLVGDETHNNDGKHVGYLGQPRYRLCDPVLFDGLHSVALLTRSVGRLASLGVFPSDTVYFDEPIDLGHVFHSERAHARSDWLVRALAATKESELVFCDPDNGITERSGTIISPRGGKFVDLDEIAAFYARGQSVVVYHHGDRTAPVPVQAMRRADQLRGATGARGLLCLRFRRGTTRLFFVVPSEECSDLLTLRSLEFLRSAWGQHFDMLAVE